MPYPDGLLILWDNDPRVRQLRRVRFEQELREQRRSAIRARRGYDTAPLFTWDPNVQATVMADNNLTGSPAGLGRTIREAAAFIEVNDDDDDDVDE